MVLRIAMLALACLLLASGQPAEPRDSLDEIGQVVAVDVAVIPVVSADAHIARVVSSVPPTARGSAGRLHRDSVFRPPRLA